jgi:hypothetical protein
MGQLYKTLFLNYVLTAANTGIVQWKTSQALFTQPFRFIVYNKLIGHSNFNLETETAQ